MWFRGPSNAYNITSGQRSFSKTWEIFSFGFSYLSMIPPGRWQHGTCMNLLGYPFWDINQQIHGGPAEAPTDLEVAAFRQAPPARWFPSGPPDLQNRSTGQQPTPKPGAPNAKATPVSLSGGSWHWHNLTRKTEQTELNRNVMFLWCVGRSGRKRVGKGSANLSSDFATSNLWSFPCFIEDMGSS